MYWGFWGIGPGIWALLVWGLIRWFAFGGRRRLSYHPDQPSGAPSALEILRQRYALGDIDAATFEQLRERLEHTDGPGEQ